MLKFPPTYRMELTHVANLATKSLSLEPVFPCTGAKEEKK